MMAAAAGAAAAIAIRKATPADTPAIRALHEASIRAACSCHYTPAQIDAWIGGLELEPYREAMRRLEFLVAEEAGGILGFSIVDVGAGELHALYVAPGSAGRGLGRALLGAAERQAASGGRTLHLKSALNAEGFYARHGYVRLGEGVSHGPGGVELRCVDMARPGRLRHAPATAAVAALLAGFLAGAARAAVPSTPATAPSPTAAPRAMAVTIDDLPGAGEGSDLARLRAMNATMLAVLKRERVPAIGFVNEGKLQADGERDARAGILVDWLDGGMDLGNHTFAHKGLTLTPLAECQDDVLRGEVVTRALLAERGRRPVWFRHPFTQTGPTAGIKAAFETFLAGRGYRTAPFTIEDADYMFDALYEAARAHGDGGQAARVRAAYTAHQARMLDWFEGLARGMFGRDIAQILLIHVNLVNADTLADRLAALRARGYRFVPLAEVLADGAYATPDLYVGPNGPSWLHRWSVAKGTPMRLRDEPDPPAWVLEDWQALQGRGGGTS